MAPSTPAESAAAWRAKLALLRDSLDELDSALQASRWEQLDPLASRVDQALRNLLASPGHPAPADANTLRQTLNLANDLQTRAATRRQQIQPLLEAWKKTAQADEPTP